MSWVVGTFDNCRDNLTCFKAIVLKLRCTVRYGNSILTARGSICRFLHVTAALKRCRVVVTVM